MPTCFTTGCGLALYLQPQLQTASRAGPSGCAPAALKTSQLPAGHSCRKVAPLPVSGPLLPDTHQWKPPAACSMSVLSLTANTTKLLSCSCSTASTHMQTSILTLWSGLHCMLHGHGSLCNARGLSLHITHVDTHWCAQLRQAGLPQLCW